MSTLASSYESIDLSDGVLTVAISAPTGGNAITRSALLEGAEVFAEVAAGRHAVGAILLVGPGANFCAGGDVRAFASVEDRPTYIHELADRLHDFVLALHATDVPVVAAVHGWAAGAGMSVVCHADIAIGGPGTSMRPAYSGIGLTPDGGLTWTLPRIVGTARARQIILTNAIVTAGQALEMGLLAQVVDSDDEILPTAQTVARTLADGPRRSLRAARQLLSASPQRTLAQQLAAEADSIAARSGEDVGIEGINAFIEKRRADFTAANDA
ncbi:enoyl-CoA hydratase/isomerase family protein [Williamsia sp. CHRR-6]|uniref:enoyl-CoA hydratase/isomerase family protein n=1 Tax=Williamsia sp. CHRR-6 TaxID=2835871 RepID=UPI001BDAC68C|nr:enoyl-CoA hydratase-related protein [Williamsia sp. CHRR-6]MBT0565424.1 enoyl-CoA hydratase/isomerase family protein [Williamsia sp. CHRR-6]